MHSRSVVFSLLLILIGTDVAHCQNKPAKMPKEDVIDVPSVGEGLCVSNVFQTNMVLQRDKPIVIWGWAAPGENVSVTFNASTQSTTANEDRSWKVTLPAMSYRSDPQSLTVRGRERTLKLDNLLIGDVWVLGGQSNMEFPLSRIENGPLEIVSANYPDIRILTVPAQNGPLPKKGFPRLHEWSSWFGHHYRKGDWDECTPEIAQELSAIGFVFARRLHMATQVPIGVIDASRGGTTVETWTPMAVLTSLDSDQVSDSLGEWDQKVADWDSQADLDRRIKNHQQKIARLKQEGKDIPKNENQPTDLKPGPAMDQNRPGNCYSSMIAPLAGLAVKGAIFHQGYNNCFNGTEGAVLYRQVFPEMIKSWRDAFNDQDLPFGILSLCTEGPVQTLDNYSEMMRNSGPFIREAQYQTFLDFYDSGDSNIGFTSTYDLRRRWYHPQLKIPAGERIARWALASQYGFDGTVRWKPPMVKEMKVENGTIVLQLDEAADAVDDESPILGFAVAGSDRKFHPAEATHRVKGNDDRGREQKDTQTLILSSPMVKNPIHYRYAWGRSPLGNLQAQRNTDIPFATQRSDTWPLEAVPLGVFGDEAPKTLDRKQKRIQGETLQKLDLERRLREAQDLIEAHLNKDGVVN